MSDGPDWSGLVEELSVLLKDAEAACEKIIEHDASETPAPQAFATGGAVTVSPDPQLGDLVTSFERYLHSKRAPKVIARGGDGKPSGLVVDPSYPKFRDNDVRGFASGGAVLSLTDRLSNVFNQLADVHLAPLKIVWDKDGRATGVKIGTPDNITRMLDS